MRKLIMVVALVVSGCAASVSLPADQCLAVDPRVETCWSCIQDSLDSGACGTEVSNECWDCAGCMGSRHPGGEPRTDCECLQDDVCLGCEAQALEYWSCLERRCSAACGGE